MIRQMFRHVRSFLKYRRRYIRTMWIVRRIDRLRAEINARQDHATRCVGGNPRLHFRSAAAQRYRAAGLRLRFESFATQMGPARSFEAMLTDLEATCL